MRNWIKVSLWIIGITAVLFISVNGFMVFKFFNKFEDIRFKIKEKEKYYLDNKFVRLQNLQNDEVVVVDFQSNHIIKLKFWATWCLPCIKELKNTSEVAENTYYITIENELLVKKFIKENNLNLVLYKCDSINLPFEPKKIDYYPFEISILNNQIIQ